MGSTSATTHSTVAYTDGEFSYGFGFDLEDGHGTHTAGSAAGAALNSPALTATCAANETLGCIGKCLSAAEETFLLADNSSTWDTLCPQFNCENGTPCLGEDVSATLTESGGIARAAKISVFDISSDGRNLYAEQALNGLWESTKGTNTFLHSNSWGSDNDCNVDFRTVAFDEYMYEVRRETYVCRGTLRSLAEMQPYSLIVGSRRGDGTWFQWTCGLYSRAVDGKINWNRYLKALHVK